MKPDWKLVRWAVTLALIGFALSQLSAETVDELLTLKSLVILAAASCVQLVAVTLNAFRWVLVARACRLAISVRQSIYWTYVGHFFNQFLPTSIGGDVVRGWMAAQKLDDLYGTVTSIALERATGLVALLVLIAVGQPMLVARLDDWSAVQVALACVVVGIGAVATLFFADRILDLLRIRRFSEPLRRLSRESRRLLVAPYHTLAALLLSFMIHGLSLVLVATIANRLGADISLLEVTLIMPTVLLMSALPVSLGGWGVREAGLAVGFTLLGQPASVAVATSLLIGVSNLVSGLPGAMGWILVPADKRRLRDTQSPAEAA